MLEIVLDTETTGLNVEDGDRIVEIGMVELDLDSYTRTGRTFHKYVNPGRAMSEEALKIHGLTDEFLKTKPKFGRIAEEFLEFIGDQRIAIHNAQFDLAFLNRELRDLGMPELDHKRVVDTVQVAQRELPKLPRHNLNALCNHFGISTAKRTKHGALLDAELLAEVYCKLLGADSGFLDAVDEAWANSVGREGMTGLTPGQRPEPLPPRITPAEEEAHAKFVATLGKKAIWRKFPAPGP